jgi:hypothetical protein
LGDGDVIFDGVPDRNGSDVFLTDGFPRPKRAFGPEKMFVASTLSVV